MIEQFELDEVVLFKGRKSDLKSIWEGISANGYWELEHNGWVIEKEEGEDIGWAKIEGIFDMGKKKWERTYGGDHHQNCIIGDWPDGNICVKHNEDTTHEKDFKCGQCDKNFMSENDLKIHVGKSHKKVSSTPETGLQPRNPVSLSASPLLDTSKEESSLNSGLVEECLSSQKNVPQHQCHPLYTILCSRFNCPKETAEQKRYYQKNAGTSPKSIVCLV